MSSKAINQDFIVTYDVQAAKQLPMRTYRSWIRALHCASLEGYEVQTFAEPNCIIVVGFQTGQGDNPFGLTYRIKLTVEAVDCELSDMGQVYYTTTPKALRASLRRNGITQKTQKEQEI